MASGWDPSAEEGRGKWGKLYQSYAAHTARHGRAAGRDTRMLLAALSRANNNGHAIFSDGELAFILGKEAKNGEIKPASRATIYSVVGKLKDAGLLVEGNPNCLWLARELWAQRMNGRTYCPVHKTYAAGSAVSDWFPEEEPLGVPLDRMSAPAGPHDPVF